MIIDPLSASKFIAVYKALLLEIDRTGPDGRKSNLIKRLVAARSRLSSDPSLIEQALAALTSKSVAVDREVVASLRNLEVENWVFLRDNQSPLVIRSPIRASGIRWSWGSTIESEISSGAWAWSWKLVWFNTLAASFAMDSYRVFFGLEKTIETTSIAPIKRSGQRGGSIRDMGRK